MAHTKSAGSRCRPQPLTILTLLGLSLAIAMPSVATTTRKSKQDQPPQALGSLSKIGEVYVNDQPISAGESTIFNGDKLRTGPDGVASFTVSGRGTLKFSPNTFVVFVGAEQYAADLRSGTVVVSSFSGPSGLAIKVGDFVVLPAVQEQQTTAKVDRALAGDASVTSLEGSVSVVSLQGAAGLLLQAGQSSTISTAGQLNQDQSATPPEVTGPQTPPPTEPTQTPPGPTAPPLGTTAAKSHKGWIILGLAGAGVVGIAAVAASSGGSGHQAISPSAP
jgi:hypothetical protein